METKNYIVMENHRKLWRYFHMTEDMQSEKKFWSTLVFQTLHMMFLFRSALFVDDVVEKVKIISPSFGLATGTCTFALAFVHHKTVFDIVSELQQHYERNKNNPKDRGIILECHGEGNRILSVYSITVVLCGICFSTKPLLDYALHYFTSSEAKIELPFPAAYPWKAEGLLFYVSYAMQIPLSWWVVWMVAVSVSTTVFFCMAAVSYLQLAQQRFREIPEECTEEEGVSLLKVALRSHQEALKMIRAVETVESVKVFSQVFSTYATLSMSLFVVYSAGELGVIVQFAILSICFAVQLGLVCFYGQKIINEGDKLYEEIYAVSWYNHSKHFKSLLTFCLMRAGRSDRVTAWSFADISMFNRVMTTAFSYFTFLQAMSE